jgi:hypothetical protein
VKPINERQFRWSFVGTVSKNREKMIKKFRSSGMVPYFLMNGISPSKMFEIYSNSIFVPNDRGHINLDCLRLYEASLCGAIPIVVGNIEEIKSPCGGRGFGWGRVWYELMHQLKSVT